MVQQNEERILRSKYLDWCSARVAEAFLKLTPEEIFELALHSEMQMNAGADGGAGGMGDAADGAAGAPTSQAPESSYRAVVARVTEVLAARLMLPDFDDWLASYRASPQRYESEMLGFWRQTAGSGGG